MLVASPNDSHTCTSSFKLSDVESDDHLGQTSLSRFGRISRMSVVIIGVVFGVLGIAAAQIPRRQATSFRNTQAVDRAVLGESRFFTELSEDSASPRLVIHFVRHAEVYNPDNIYYGRLPGFKLSAEGLLNAQGPGAEALAKARQHVQKTLHLNHTSGWFVSPMLRTRQTAAALAAGQPDFDDVNTQLFMTSVVDSQLNEALVSAQGKPFKMADFFAEQPKGEGFETFPDLLKRMQSFVGRLLHDPKHIGTQVVAVSHGDPIWAVRLWATIGEENILSCAPSVPANTNVDRPDHVSVTTVVFPKESPMMNLKWLH